MDNNTTWGQYYQKRISLVTGKSRCLTVWSRRGHSWVHFQRIIRINQRCGQKELLLCQQTCQPLWTLHHAAWRGFRQCGPSRVDCHTERGSRGIFLDILEVSNSLAFYSTLQCSPWQCSSFQILGCKGTMEVFCRCVQCWLQCCCS